jgi:GMP synthase (glutamine-hydrolysing)
MSDPVLRGLPDEWIVLHWHGDMFELPASARLLASTPLCANQAFQLGTRMFGLQFHCEVGEEQVEHFLQADAAFVERAGGSAAIAQIRRDTARLASSSWVTGERLLRNILDAMLEPTRTPYASSSDTIDRR